MVAVAGVAVEGVGAGLAGEADPPRNAEASAAITARYMGVAGQG